jgi:hypothetical protein
MEDRADFLALPCIGGLLRVTHQVRDCCLSRHWDTTNRHSVRVLSVVLLDAAVRFVSDDNLVLPTTQPRPNRHISSKDASQGLHDGGKSGKGQGQSGHAAGLYVPRGSILCICPIESHHDPALYPDQPWAFNPDRWAGLTGVARLWSLTVMLCRGRQKQPCKLPMLATRRESLINLWSWEGVGSTFPESCFVLGSQGKPLKVK